MKLHLQAPDTHLVTGLGEGWIKVGVIEHRSNCILTPEGVHEGFAPGGFDALTEADFGALLDYEPEIVLLGTGAMQRFPHPRTTAPLTMAQVGVEVMDTRAACRTWNILAAEDRRVVAALILADLR
jgi:uncharacterized protein